MNNDARTNIRIPAELLKKIDADAKKELRSRSAQIVFVLKEHYEKMSSEK